MTIAASTSPTAATQNLNVVGTRSIIAPRRLKAEMPVSHAATDTVLRGRSAIRDIVHGREARCRLRHG